MKNINKIVVLFVGVVLLIAMVVAGLSFRAFNQVKKTAEARKHTLVLINSANELMSALIDAETGQRGYLLTSDNSFLEPYFAVRGRISDDLKELRQRSLTPAAYIHLDVAAPLIVAKLAELSQVIELCHNHDMTAALARVRSGQGKRLMDSIRAEMSSFIQIEEAALARRDAKFQSSMRSLSVIIVATWLLALLFASLFVYFINRETQYRLKNLVHLETQHLLLIQEDTNKKLQQANVTLQISEEKLAVTLNSIGDAVLATDAKGYVTLLNPRAEQLTGWTHVEALGRPVEEIFHIVHEETRLPATIPVRETLEHGTTKGLANHTVLIARSGSERAIADSCASIRNRDGQVVGAVLVFRDVTEEYEAREYAESIINTVREPLIVLDQDLRVVTASRSFYEVFKVNTQETVRQLIYDLGNKQWDIPKLRELLETILPEKTTFDNYEVEHDFTDIGRRIMLLNARQVKRRWGQERIILLAIEDITERKVIEGGLEKARKELAVTKIAEDEAREYAESIINTVREPLIALDQDLRVVNVSRSFYEFFKVSPKETVGQLIYDLGNKQWDIPKLRELLETILPEKATFDGYEVEHDFTTIGRRTMLLNARQIKRKLGKEKILLLAMEDVTERKAAEKLLQELVERKSSFVANVSHELKNPLSVIRESMSMILGKFAGEVNEKQKEILEIGKRSTDRLIRLVSNLLDLSKIEAGKMQLKLEVIHPDVLVEEVLKTYEREISKKQLVLQKEIPLNIGAIVGDRDKLT